MQRRHFLKMNLAGMAGAAALPQLAAGQDHGGAERGDALERLSFTTAEYHRRYEALRAAMDAQGVDVLLITGNRDAFEADMANLKYVGAATGYMSNVADFVVFPKDRDPIRLITTGAFLPSFPPPPHIPIETEPAPVKNREGDYPPNETPDYDGVGIALLKRLGLESATIGLGRARTFPSSYLLNFQRELPNASFVDADKLMYDVRAVKSEEELAFMRRSALNCDMGHEAMMEVLRAGHLNHRDVYYAVDEVMARRGGALSGTPQFMSNHNPDGGHGFSVHGSATAFRPGDLIMNEITTQYQGYFTQMIVPIILGEEPDAEFVEAWEMNDVMYKAASDALRPGANSREVDKAAADAVAEASGGRYEAMFTSMTVEKEYTFTHDWDVHENIPFSLLPMIRPAEGHQGFRGHVYANSVIAKDGPPEVLQKTSMEFEIV